MRAAMILVSAALLAGAARPAGTGWNREGAARYLDERMDIWFAKAKKLRTGQGETSCVSCHTSVPYALARPALRRAMGASTPTPQEQRLVTDVMRRVETFGSHQPMYDSSDAKTAESRGTEPVLYALILASLEAAQGEGVPGESTRKAFVRMWETQRPDGAWDWLDFGLEPFESPGAVYHGATLAALAAGMAPSLSKAEGALAGAGKLRSYLTDRYHSQNLYNRVWLLLASARLSGLLTPARRNELLAEIESRQQDDGGWSLFSLGTWKWDKTAAPFQPPGTLDPALLGKPDGYATGLIVYALRTAGLATDHPVVSRGLRWLRANQQEVAVNDQSRPAWRSHSLNHDREHGGDKGEPWRRMFMSDAATAFAVLALAGQQ